MIFIDSNIPMYLVGAPHPHKTDVRRWLEELVSGRERLVTDAEVLQEILHRYVSIDRRDAIQPAFDALLGIVDEGHRGYPQDVIRGGTSQGDRAGSEKAVGARCGTSCGHANPRHRENPDLRSGIRRLPRSYSVGMMKADLFFI